MKAYYDIHIHSVLSSCADESQTPNNILNMCMLKGLDMISITDHNSLKQFQTIDAIKDSYDFFVLYGVEITVKEGFHVLAYFEKISEAMAFDNLLDAGLDHSVLPPSEQVICDVYDCEESRIGYYLNQKVSYSFKDIIKMIRALDGVVIPAHINRSAGILGVYPDISKFDIDAVEIYAGSDVSLLEEEHPEIKKYRYLFNSDAHSIELINEKEHYMDLKDLSFKGFKKWLRG